jgi:diguanylate cyclase (GGDEF)-like protein
VSTYDLLLLSHVISGAMLVGLLVLVLSSRREPLVPRLAACFSTLLLWTVAYVLELASADLSAKVLWANVQFIGATVLPLVWFLAMRSAVGARPLPHWALAGLGSAGAAILAGIFINPGSLFRGHPALDTSGSIAFMAADYGPLYYFIWAPFAWSLLIASLVVLARGFRRGRGLVRWRSRLLFLATLLPMVAGALYSGGVLPWRNFNPAMASLSVSCLLCAVALLRYRLLQLTPLARDAVIEQLADGIVVSDAGGLVTDFNAAASAILPELTPQALGMPLADLLAGREGFAHSYGAARVAAPRDGSQPERDDIDEESTTLAVQDRGGAAALRYYSLRVAPVRRRNGRRIGEALVLHDVTRRVELYRSARRLAATDELTGLLARRELLDLGVEQASRCRRQGRPMTALLIDLDRFKLVNDRHGHAAGDQVLRVVAAACAEQLRNFDLLGRYGGDELCALLPGVSGELALAVAERLRVAVSGLSAWCDGELIRVTVSVGVAVADAPSRQALLDLIATADRALYRAKNSGRNRVAAMPSAPACAPFGGPGPQAAPVASPPSL